MTFDKFNILLDSRSLYFRRVDKYLDTNESLLPHRLYSEDYYLKMCKGVREAAKAEAHFQKILHERRRYYFVSCWTRGPAESDALWKLYATIDSGLIIQSDISSIESVLNNDHHEFHIGEINYVNLRSDDTVIDQYHKSHMYKEEIYAYENEIRAVLFDMNHNEDGVSIPVDLNTMIHRIIIHPRMKESIKTKLERLLKKHSYLNDRVKTTTAYYNPITSDIYPPEQ